MPVKSKAYLEELDKTRCKIMDRVVRRLEKRGPATASDIYQDLKKEYKREDVNWVIGELIVYQLIERIPSTPGTAGRPTVRYKYVG